MSMARMIYEEAFGPDAVRTPRSAAYKQGALDALMFSAGDIPAVKCPHAPGSAEYDAYFAGVGEGHARWRERQRAMGATGR